MSRFAHHHPEDHEGAWDRLVDRADHDRKAARENGAAQYAVADNRPAPRRDPGPHAELAFALRLFLADWSERARAAGKISPHSLMHLSVFGDGTARLVDIYGAANIGNPSASIAETFAEAERFLARDEKAECNIALGLTPDGRFADEAAE